jgi:hypothetical protein
MDEPFVVQRGPRFNEPGFIIKMTTESIDELPMPLINNCKIFREQVENGRN